MNYKDFKEREGVRERRGEGTGVRMCYCKFEIEKGKSESCHPTCETQGYSEENTLRILIYIIYALLDLVNGD